MAIPANTTADEVKKVEKPIVVKESKPKPAEETIEVRSILSKIMLVNPYTKVRVPPGVVVDKVEVSSWWESQVEAGLAEWQ